MVPEDYHCQSDYTWIQGGEEYISPRLLPPPFTPNQLIQMTIYTPPKYFKHGEKGKTKWEMIKWFMIIILATRFEFGDRASMWFTISQSKYRSAPDSGNTGKIRYRLYMLWRHV